MCTSQSEVIHWLKDAMPRNRLKGNKNWHCHRVNRQIPREPRDRGPSRGRNLYLQQTDKRLHLGCPVIGCHVFSHAKPQTQKFPMSCVPSPTLPATQCVSKLRMRGATPLVSLRFHSVLTTRPFTELAFK